VPVAWSPDQAAGFRLWDRAEGEGGGVVSGSRRAAERRRGPKVAPLGRGRGRFLAQEPI